MSSKTYPGDMGGLAGADANCQQLALGAGLAGTFRAWLSTSTVTAASRLAGARGWTLVDGRPVADLVTDLVPDNKILHPIMLDETGKLVSMAYAKTGTKADGTPNSNLCGDWTVSDSSSLALGAPHGGPAYWTDSPWSGSCSSGRPIYCFQVDGNAPLVVQKYSGNRVFVTESKVLPTALGLSGGRRPLCIRSFGSTPIRHVQGASGHLDGIGRVPLHTWQAVCAGGRAGSCQRGRVF